MPHSETITKGIRVAVTSEYVPERSDPTMGQYFFAYHVTLSNESDQTVQLISRHWIITDAMGKVEEVRGPGVIGEQPVLEPGGTHRYSSFCPLMTPTGSMEGSYQMRLENGTMFDAAIAKFQLAPHYTLH